MILSIELEEDVGSLRQAIAAECEKRFNTKTVNEKLVFDLLADIEFELRKQIAV